MLLLILSDPLKFQDMREEDGRLSVPLWDSDFMPWGKSNQEVRDRERRIFSAMMMHGSGTLPLHVWQRCHFHLFYFRGAVEDIKPLPPKSSPDPNIMPSSRKTGSISSETVRS